MSEIEAQDMSKVTVESEMAGSIWKILVQVGSDVQEGDTLIIIEAMKMEIPVIASDSGRVTEILVKEGDQVSDGDPVVRLDA
jgi:acetyl-CoA carboxylase biotin carboxyl carrier protein